MKNRQVIGWTGERRDFCWPADPTPPGAIFIGPPDSSFGVSGSVWLEWMITASVPWAAVCLTLALPPAAWYGLRGQRRRRPGRCAVCGYDLRATPGRCPECGNPAPPPGVQGGA